MCLLRASLWCLALAFFVTALRLVDRCWAELLPVALLLAAAADVLLAACGLARPLGVAVLQQRLAYRACHTSLLPLTLLLLLLLVVVVVVGVVMVVLLQIGQLLRLLAVWMLCLGSFLLRAEVLLLWALLLGLQPLLEAAFCIRHDDSRGSKRDCGARWWRMRWLHCWEWRQRLRCCSW